LCASTTGFSIENYDRRFVFGDQKGNAVSTTSEEALFGHSFKKMLDGFISGDSNQDKQSDSFSKLALLKKFLSSSSSSSDKKSKIDRLFQILNNNADDENNESSSSSNKLNRLLGFLNNNQDSSSNNLQLAKKLLNLAQGNDGGGSSSLSFSDMKSLAKLMGK
jgi:hypothetical protein